MPFRPNFAKTVKPWDPSVGLITGFTAPALNTPVQNNTGFNIWMSIRIGVISKPTQNGHAYMEVSADNISWSPTDYCACRCNLDPATSATGVVAGGPNIGAGIGLNGFIPKGWWYRIRTATIAGYTAPTYVYESSAGYFMGIMN